MSERVSIDASAWSAAAQHLTGLTGRFRGAAPQESPRVIVVDGSLPGWPAAAEQAAASAAAVLVVDPDASVSCVTLAELEALVRCLRESAAAVVLADPWVQAGSLPAVRAAWAAVHDETAFIDVVAEGEVRLERLLAVVHAGLGIRPSLVALEQREDAVLASGRTDTGAPVLLRALAGRDEPRCTVTAVLHRGALTWRLPGRGDAAPSTLTVSDPEGTRLLPTIYASPYRQALLLAHLVATGTSGGPAAEPVDELASLVAGRRHLDAERRRLDGPRRAPSTATPTEQDTP